MQATAHESIETLGGICDCEFCLDHNDSERNGDPLDAVSLPHVSHRLLDGPENLLDVRRSGRTDPVSLKYAARRCTRRFVIRRNS